MDFDQVKKYREEIRTCGQLCAIPAFYITETDEAKKARKRNVIGWRVRPMR